jgi:hypothetical protein
VIDSKWFYKVKCATDGNVEKYKDRFTARGFPRKRELTMRRPMLWLLGIPL